MRLLWQIKQNADWRVYTRFVGLRDANERDLWDARKNERKCEFGMRKNFFFYDFSRSKRGRFTEAIHSGLKLFEINAFIP